MPRGKTRICSPRRTPPVVEHPGLRALRPGLPLAELVAERQDAFLGPRPLLVASRAAERRIETMVLERVQQRDGLQPVARRARGLLPDPASVDRLLHGGDDQLMATLREAPVAELDDLDKVVTGVDVQDRERKGKGRKRLLREKGLRLQPRARTSTTWREPTSPKFPLVG